MEQVNPLKIKNTFSIEGPQPGAQERFCAAKADIAIGGGAFFGGKSVALCMLAGRNVKNEYYNGVIFRRTYPEIVAGGGLWDIARRLYPQMNGVPTENDLTYTFSNGSKIKFSHLQHEKDLNSHLSSAYCFLGFDQLEEFNENMFFFLLARNRPAPGYLWKCSCRATCNPRPGWLADLIGWWWDPNTGYPIKERSGVIRYFTRIKDKIVWFKDHLELNGLFYENKLVNLELPATMEMKVIETDPGFRGNTVKAGTKPAKLETGVIVGVPLFINSGDVIKVDTRTKEYLGRI